ncbi:hypothetical protein SK128_000766 [Halocaridina rubra]|uniref:Uncharacterized protein n=1 Tax=Halocaridina rubra TaxID=373956 RepID=A0AAN9ADJ0_HALRR
MQVKHKSTGTNLHSCRFHLDTSQKENLQSLEEAMWGSGSSGDEVKENVKVDVKRNINANTDAGEYLRRYYKFQVDFTPGKD